MIEYQLKYVIKVDFLRLEKVHLKYNVIPVDYGFALLCASLFATQPIPDIVIGRPIVLDPTVSWHLDRLELHDVIIAQPMPLFVRSQRYLISFIDLLELTKACEFIVVLEDVLDT
ncbi:hypothetical protein D3C73_713990 [compost metagenome]